MDPRRSGMVERKYAYHRVAPGLILLPGNDGQTFYAVGKYEDGPSAGLVDEPRDFEAWGWGRIPEDVMVRLPHMDREDAISVLRDYAIDNVWPRHKTMAAAIEDALSREEQG